MFPSTYMEVKKQLKASVSGWKMWSRSGTRLNSSRQMDTPKNKKKEFFLELKELKEDQSWLQGATVCVSVYSIFVEMYNNGFLFQKYSIDTL